MAYLNAQEREALLQELKKLNTFNRAKGRLQRIDPKGRLALFRNNQSTGKWITRFDLSGLGTRVTLVEEFKPRPKHSKQRADYELIDIIVEPLPDNRT
jgi:hypothetical protein